MTSSLEEQVDGLSRVVEGAFLVHPGELVANGDRKFLPAIHGQRDPGCAHGVGQDAVVVDSEVGAAQAQPSGRLLVGTRHRLEAGSQSANFRVDAQVSTRKDCRVPLETGNDRREKIAVGEHVRVDEPEVLGLCVRLQAIQDVAVREESRCLEINELECGIAVAQRPQQLALIGLARVGDQPELTG